MSWTSKPSGSRRRVSSGSEAGPLVKSPSRMPPWTAGGERRGMAGSGILGPAGSRGGGELEGDAEQILGGVDPGVAFGDLGHPDGDPGFQCAEVFEALGQLERTGGQRGQAQQDLPRIAIEPQVGPAIGGRGILPPEGEV